MNHYSRRIIHPSWDLHSITFFLQISSITEWGKTNINLTVILTIPTLNDKIKRDMRKQSPEIQIMYAQKLFERNDLKKKIPVDVCGS